MTTPSEYGFNGLNELDRCKTCSHTRLWHDTNKPQHPFNDGTAQSTMWMGRRSRDASNQPQRGAERPSWPIDPVLRQALIDKGVLTPQDLRDAEDKIRAVSALFEGGRGGEGEVQVGKTT